MSKLNDRMIAALNAHAKGLVDELARDAYNLCKEAMSTKETRNRTGAQMDAFFFIVTYKGYILRCGAPVNSVRSEEHRGLEGTWWKTGKGADWWVDFYEAEPEQTVVIDRNTGKWRPKNVKHHINEVAPQATYNKNGYDIYILNAAYYTGWLERGIKGGKWRVISQINSSCKQVAEKYKGRGAKRAEVHRIGLGGEPFKQG